MTTSREATDLAGISADLRLLLPSWLGEQRWFGGKDRAVHRAEPVLVEPVWADEDPAGPVLLLVIVRTDGDEWYQLQVGVRTMAPAVPAAAVIGHSAGAVLYEAAADPELMGRLLRRIATGDATGTVEFHRVPGGSVPDGLPAVVVTAEQSNTSIAFGDRLMLKLLRRLVPGPNPELEMLLALQSAGGVPSAAPLGWIRTSDSAPGGAITLGILQEFVPNSGDGWSLAVQEARACIAGTCESVSPAGGFADEARGLGRATAVVHAALADRLETRRLGVGEVDDFVDVLTGRLDAALDQVPALLPFAQQLRAVHQHLGRAVGRGNIPLSVQRIHGDLHLGQALRARTGWVLIDFEGEPGHPYEERRMPQPALRDIASMLRSFDYAAHHALAEVAGGPPGDEPPQFGPGTRAARRASAWAVHTRREFCAGYTEGGGVDPRSRPVLLRAFEADKAVYEAVYEAHNRPEWLPIPLAAVRRIAAAAAARPAG